MRFLLTLALLAALPSTAQPVLIADVDPGSADGNVTELVVFNDALYFSGKATGGTELWRYAPASSAAERVTNLQGQSLKPSDFVELNGFLYFNGTDEAHGRELWRFDPTTDEAELVADIFPGPDPSSPGSITAFDGDLYFSALTPTSLRELWRYDPETDTAEQTPEIRANGSASPVNLTPLGDLLYFRAFEDAVGDELWAYNPATDENVLVADILPGDPSGEPRPIVAFGGQLYFFARSDGDAPLEQLWTYDPVAGMSTKVADIPAGTGEDWRPDGLFPLGDALYFFAGSEDGADDLWRHRPATETTELVADLPPGNDDQRPRPLARLDDILFFAASADDTGRELWQFDSSTGVVSRVSDIHPGEGSSDPVDAVVLDGALYFSAADGVNGRELWRYARPAVATGEAPVLAGVSEVAPNPTLGTAQVTLVLEAPGDVRLTVLDALGRTVATSREALSAGAHGLSVPTAGLTAGAYVVRVEAPGGIATRRMTVAR